MSIFATRARFAALGLLAAGSILASQPLVAQAAFSTLDKTAGAEVRFSAAERGQPILAGSEVAVTGENFRPGQQVTLLYGKQPIPGAAFTANAEGKIEGKLTVPASAVSGIHPILVVAEGPYHATVTDLKVSPTIPLSGQSGYKLLQADVTRGLYQSAYSPKTNTLFVTSAVGRPPVSQSELVKLNADSLKVLSRVTPAEAPAPAPRPGAPAAAPGEPAKPSVFAVYGVGIDDSKGTVWVTNTRQNTVAVYNQADLSLVKQFAPGTVNHARDVLVDEPLGKAYASATGTPKVVVFDTGKLDVLKTIEIKSGQRGKEFSATSLSLDPKAHRLYTVSLSTGEVAVINTQTDAVEKLFQVPGVRAAIGVSHDPVTGRIFVAAQGSDNLVVLDGADGKVLADTPIGAGALNVAFDPVKRRAYVSNRGAGTVAVTDVDGKIVANLGPAPQANHVSLGKGGVVYAVDKSANARNVDGDAVLRIQPR